MMEVECSPRHSNAVTQLMSPTHGHRDSVDSFASMRQIRQSLSRTPSKPQRFSLATTHSVPRSPSGLSRVCGSDSSGDSDRPRYAAKRIAACRSNLRRPSHPSPPRRALSDNVNHANAVPRFFRAPPFEDTPRGQENSDSGKRFTDVKDDVAKHERTAPLRRESVLHSRVDSLERNHGLLDLEVAKFGSPQPKRRSVYSTLLPDSSSLSLGLDGTASDCSEPCSSLDRPEHSAGSPSPFVCAMTGNSPARRSFSLRRSTLQQRTTNTRSRLFAVEGKEPGSPAPGGRKTRASLDSNVSLRTLDGGPDRAGEDLFPPLQKTVQQIAKAPHPLSFGEIAALNDENVPKVHREFSKSLPVCGARPAKASAALAHPSSHEAFATPAAFNSAKPLQQAFHSTGFISKRNNTIDLGSSLNSNFMPDTPSKKPSIHMLDTPAPSVFGRSIRPSDLNIPDTPFVAKVDWASGRGGNIFGSIDSTNRRASLFSATDSEDNNSPTHRFDSQSSNEEMPPTPTKSVGPTGTPRPQSKGKNSLRSSLFGRRTSVVPDTFAEKAEQDRTAGPTRLRYQSGDSPPVTPQDASMPDPSSLYISADYRPRESLAVRASADGIPATPTGPRADQSTFASTLGGNKPPAYISNDVDTTITARFARVSLTGNGEFSQVYRVQDPLVSGIALPSRGNPAARIWAVKKSRKQYLGNRDRMRKLKEVSILRALRGNEHILEFIESWEAESHLYIMTEYCENGNLKDFLLQAGFKSRLDDFRIWKILLELAQGVKAIHDANYMHLDLKPANVFIDWEGVLKIGDFGMASEWPAPADFEGEGDREYIGPEVLYGKVEKASDVFALGMIVLETAGNIVLPDNGLSWQRLRAGDLSDLPSLTWTSESSLNRDEHGNPLDTPESSREAFSSYPDERSDDLGFLRPVEAGKCRNTCRDLVTPPNFMVDQTDPDSLENVVQWMIKPDPARRPTVDQLLMTGGVQWVDKRRRSGATIYEGSWGPADAVVTPQDVEMVDV